MLDNLNLPDEALTKVVEVVGEHAGETYDNLVQPVSKEAGVTLESILKIITAPLQYLSDKEDAYFSHKLQAYKRDLDEKVGEIPKEKRVDPDLHTILEAVDHSRFCITDDELRSMFVNLIAGTMNTDTAEYVHPAYAAIIRQMSSCDAKVLRRFKGSATLTYRYFDDILSGFKASEIEMSLCNLERLGLIRIKRGIDLSDVAEIRSALDTYDKFHFASGHRQKREAELTELGKQFVNVCC